MIRYQAGAGAVLMVFLLHCTTTETEHGIFPEDILLPLEEELAAVRSTYDAAALSYVEAALDTIASHHVFGTAFDWEEWRLAALEHTAGAQRRSETYAAIRFALSDLRDRQVSFQEPVPDSEARVSEAPPPREVHLIIFQPRVFEGRTPYLLVPSFSETQVTAVNNYAATLHGLIQDMDSPGMCGWIVDLRQNDGGNMWPMLAGVGPLLGEGVVGAFVDRDSTILDWYYKEGKAGTEVSLARVFVPYRLSGGTPPVAVLVSRQTGGAGEAVAVAFRGRPNTRFFGQTTAGVATSAGSFRLSDGATIGFSVARFMDRTGLIYDAALEPDVQVEREFWEEPDDALQAALLWLRQQPTCSPR